MDWAMRYTFHAGYEPPGFRPQFAATLGTDSPAEHVRFAAEQGVAGILYPWAADRGASEVAGVAAALEDTGLAGSCLLAIEPAMMFAPLWTDRSAAGRAALAAAVERSCKMATSLRTGVLAALIMADPERHDIDQQRDHVVANLAEMGRLAADHGKVIGLEPMTVLPLMFQTVGAALDVIRRTGSNDVGLIYDTGHVAMTESELLPSFVEAFDHVVLFQLADLPGRVEPGAGEIDLLTVAAEAIRRGYTGLVDLEHGWSLPDRAGEAGGLVRLRAFDARLRAAAA